jgi:hypothetical protein
MAWFRNYYKCARCDYEWQDEWSCTCEDDCPECGARHMSPHESDDLTEVIEKEGHEFVVLRSLETAGYFADYHELGRFATRIKAETFLAHRQ